MWSGKASQVGFPIRNCRVYSVKIYEMWDSDVMFCRGSQLEPLSGRGGPRSADASPVTVVQPRHGSGSGSPRTWELRASRTHHGKLDLAGAPRPRSVPRRDMSPAIPTQAGLRQTPSC